jgi:hypothetical protein
MGSKDASRDVIRDAEIKRAMLFVGKQIDVVNHRDRRDYGFRARSLSARGAE